MTIEEYAKYNEESVEDMALIMSSKFGLEIGPGEDIPKHLEPLASKPNFPEGTSGKEEEPEKEQFIQKKACNNLPLIDSEENEVIAIILCVKSTTVILRTTRGSELLIRRIEFLKVEITPGNVVGLRKEKGEPWHVLYSMQKEKWQMKKLKEVLNKKVVTASVLSPYKRDGDFFINVFGWCALLYANQIPSDVKLEVGQQIRVVVTKFFGASAFELAFVSMTKVGKFARKEERQRSQELNENLKERKKEEFENLNVGDVVKCFIDKIERNYVIVRIGNLHGIIREKDLLWSKVYSLESYFSVGEPIDAKILEKDIDESGKFLISLSHKACLSDIWDTEIEAGDEVSCTLVAITEDGVFLSIAKGLEGFMHRRDMTRYEYAWIKEEKNIGDDIDAVVKSFDKVSRTLRFSTLPYVEHNWQEGVYEEEFSVGNMYESTVVDVDENGMWVCFDYMLETYIHKSEIQWKNVGNSTDYEVGQTVQVLLTKMNSSSRTVGASIKRITPDPWTIVDPELQGQKINVLVTGYGKNVIMVETKDSLHLIGRIRMSEISWNYDGMELPDSLKPVVGESVDVKVVLLKKEQRILELSIRQLQEDPWGNIEVGASVEGEVGIKRPDNTVEITLRNGLKAYSEEVALEKLFGKRLDFKVIEFNRTQDYIKLSHSQLVYDKRNEEIVKRFFY